MNFVVTVFLYVFNYANIRLGIMDFSDNKDKKKDDKLKKKDLILGIDVFFQNKKLYAVYHILNALAFILTFILCFIVETSNNSNWEALLRKMSVFSAYLGFAILITNYIYNLISKHKKK